jgi:ABC-type transport system involved in multi-copper enzyme maturation permease subunit
LGKTGVTVFFMVISSWSWFLGIFFGVSTFRADQRDGVLPLVLAQPLTRFEYLFSRILGTWFIVSSYYLMSLLLMAVCLSITTKAWLLGPEAIYALGLTSVSLFAVVIVSTFLSLFFDRMPALVSMSFVCLIVFAANSAFAETPMSELFNNMSFWRGLGVSVHMLLPRFSVMSSMANAILTENVTVYNSWIEAAHFVLTTGGIFALTAWIFQRRDIA